MKKKERSLVDIKFPTQLFIFPFSGDVGGLHLVGQRLERGWKVGHWRMVLVILDRKRINIGECHRRRV